MHNGKWTSINLCDDCAKKNAADIPGIEISGIVSAVEKLQNAADLKSKKAAQPVPADSMPPCPSCNWSETDIRKNNGKLGCPGCYMHFSPILK